MAGLVSTSFFLLLVLTCTINASDLSFISHDHNAAMTAVKHEHANVMASAMAEHMMHGMYGNYPMTREASGTSWVPDSSPVEGIHKMHYEWMLMFLGFSYLVFDDQRGPRGGKKVFDENMLMFMTQKDIERYTFAFRSMFSLEPGTEWKCGYPLLLQTGETCDGKTPLIDFQHPHNLFMELALVNTLRVSENSSVFLYTALPGEPALGPPVYIMRFSSEYIPETPITHHWMDSTHITFGVITAGYVYKNAKFEVCGFKGREPSQHKWRIEKPKLDSYSLRFSLNPTNDLALQLSYGFLKSREQLEPFVNTKRWVMSGIYNKSWKNNNLQAAAMLGINKDEPGNLLPGFLIEATAEFDLKHLCFARFETVNKDDLFVAPCPLACSIFNVNKLTLGYVREWVTGHLKWGLGGLIDFPFVPKKIKSFYGNDTSFMIFLQMKLV